MNAFRVDFDCDIYVTGSNAYLLSSEYSTYLSGRCVEIKMLSLSFREFLDFHGFEIRQTQSALGGTRKQVVDGNGAQYDLRDAFQAFLRFGGMLGIAEVGLDQEKAMTLLDGIYSTVVMRDILDGRGAEGGRLPIRSCFAALFYFSRTILATAFLLDIFIKHALLESGVDILQPRERYDTLGKRMLTGKH